MKGEFGKKMDGRKIGVEDWAARTEAIRICYDVNRIVVACCK